MASPLTPSSKNGVTNLESTRLQKAGTEAALDAADKPVPRPGSAKVLKPVQKDSASAATSAEDRLSDNPAVAAMASKASPAKPAMRAQSAAEKAEQIDKARAQRPRHLAEPRVEYLPGEVIGDRYKLVRPLGEGGMGVVWVAHSLVLDIDVALKLIHAELAGSAVASRMAREAHAAARLGHPAIVRVFDFGWTGRGDPYVVMELVQGESLGAMLNKQTRVGAIQAVQMLLPIADGLRTAHDKGIIHRDIKPDNIFIARDEFGRQQPKLLDFGIAKLSSIPQSQPRKLTQAGVVLGSPEYMSPEQALGDDDIDSRADVWAFSVVLYETITGKLPFERGNYNALMHAIINDAPAPTTDLNAGDVDLWRVIERGLAKNREQRWASITELGEALALWLYEHGVKEDISANSLRSVWLDGTLSGVRMELSESPMAFPASPTQNGLRRNGGSTTVIREQAEADSLPSAGEVDAASSSLEASIEDVVFQKKPRRALWIGSAVATALAIVLLVASFSGGASPADSPNKQEAKAPHAEPPKAAGVAPTPTMEPSAAQSADPEPAAVEPPKTQAEAPPDGPAPSESKAKPARAVRPQAAPVEKSKPRPSSPPRGSGTNKTRYDFGF